MKLRAHLHRSDKNLQARDLTFQQQEEREARNAGRVYDTGGAQALSMVRMEGRSEWKERERPGAAGVDGLMLMAGGVL
ncbi:hypothetical protein E2C01_082823 [Portunus trituberculatus]|uniref:Uncharacterized protein n=1 Tax=Portunus trituberculatus TaxID=210409 RepID=A0A5B7ITC3_PORTR|nr:hypothetical protein [Portunus trituberculatus]